MSILKYSDVEILRKELVVLKHVSFSLEEGEFAYLIGRVGSGKSSLMKSIYAEIPLFTGNAEVMGTQLVGIKRKEIPALRRNIGIVFQDFQLLTDRTVYDNLRFVLDATGWRDRVEIDDRIEQVLRQVGMHNKSYKMPHELSGGEQQRIVIARRPAQQAETDSCRRAYRQPRPRDRPAHCRSPAGNLPTGDSRLDGHPQHAARRAISGARSPL